VHTTSKEWSFPYCTQCATHVRNANNAVIATAFIIIASLVAAGCLYFFTITDAYEYTESVFGILVGIGIITGGVFAYKSLMAKAQRMCNPNCTRVKSAVGYLGWEGSCHMFEIASSEYALDFMVANQSKLVNVSPKVWQWLQANGYGASPHQPRSARRHMR